ncbi:MAG: GIDE domain-containing protein [Haloferacaceae archaeon]
MGDPRLFERGSRPSAAVVVCLVTGFPLQISIDALAFFVFLFGLGLLLIYRGFNEYRVGRLIRDTATETVQAAAVGRTELEGVAEPAGGVLARPFTDGGCLYAHYRIDEEHEDSDGDKSWRTLDHDTWATDFYLDDGTGEVLVEPEVSAKFEISDEHTTRIVVPEGRSAPDEVAEFLEQGTDVDRTSGHKRRYVEEVIPPEETVYVLGGAEIRTDAEGRDHESLVIRRDDGSDRFVVSDMTEETLTTVLSRRAPMMIVFGLALSAFSLYMLLTELGIG